jgi:hypothetical protein
MSNPATPDASVGVITVKARIPGFTNGAIPRPAFDAASFAPITGSPVKSGMITVRPTTSSTELIAPDGTWSWGQSAVLAMSAVISVPRGRSMPATTTATVAGFAAAAGRSFKRPTPTAADAPHVSASPTTTTPRRFIGRPFERAACRKPNEGMKGLMG